MLARRSLKSGTYRKTAGAKALAARRQKRTLRRVSRGMTSASFKGIERKVIDVPTTATALGTAGTVYLLNGMVPGVGDNQRVGRRATLKSLQIRGHVYSADQSTNQAKVRMLVVWDKQPTGALPAYSVIMSNTDNAGAVTSDYQSFVNMDYRDRFEIIRDRNFVFPLIVNTATQAVSSGGDSIFDVAEYIKLSHEITFNAGTAGTIADITTGALYLVWVSSEAAASGNAAQWNTRIRYLDA